MIFSLVLLLQGSSHAQLTGTKSIPGDYANITAAITDLNTVGVGAGGVVFNVAAGFTETGVNVVLTCATNPPSVSRPITFQKSGAGANPLLTAGVGVSTTTDGIFKLNGVSYVTIDGIDLVENGANIDPTTQMEWGYALVKQSGTLACQFTTIKNCTVTLNKANTASTGIYSGNHLATVTTSLTVTAFTGTASYNKFYNNTVQNSYFGYQIQGFVAAAPYDLYDQFNEIGTTAGGRSQVLNFGGSTISAYGIYGIYQNNMKIFNTNINSTGGTNNTGTLNGIFTSTGTNSNIDIYGDTVTVVSGATTSQLIGINNTFGSTGAGNTVNIYNNVVTGCSYPTATSGEFRGINTAATSASTNIYNNKVTGNTHLGTGNWSGIYTAGSSVSIMLNMNIYNNEVSGNTKSGTAGNLYCIYASSSTQTTNLYGNNLFNNSASSTSGVVYGYYNFAVGYNENVYNNNVYNITGGTGEVLGFFVKSGSGPTDKQVYGNNVYGLSGFGVVGGINVDYGTNVNFSRNNVYNLTSNSTSLTQAVYGISYGTSVGQNVNINNNFISDLKSPVNSNVACVMGLWLQGSGSTVAKVYYNSVYLNAASTGVNFGTAAMYINSSPFSVDLRNNVLVNVSSNAGTGRTIALQRVTTLLTNYNVLSSNNCLYAGTPGAANLIYTDGVNFEQTLQNFKDRVTPREQASFTELPPFINVGATPYNLRMQSAVPTQCESGGQVVDVTVDFDNQTRSATFPDVGADEFTGITNDLASPNIVYSNLTNDGVSAARTISNFAVITDPSGINTTAGTRPRIYYKKSTNANTFADNTSATDGWKWVEASNTSSPFSFSVNYANLLGGSVTGGDIIQYFVIAQDNNGTPRIGLNAGAFTLLPTSVNLAAANFPLTSTINQYTITANTYTGTIPVGSAETITSLTNPGGLFSLINAGTLSGNVTVNITSDLTAETGTFPLNQFAETGPGGYTITIQPSAAVTRLISGSTGLGLIRLDGADRVRIDGRFGGSGQYLTFRNLSTLAPTVSFVNDAQNNIVRNCILEGNSTATTGNLGGVVNLGTTTGANGNDNNIITFNDIRDRSDAVGRPAIGILASGTVTTLQQFNNNCTISNNTIHDFYIDGSTGQFGVSILTGNSGWNLDSNSIYQTVTRTNTITGAVTRAINIQHPSPLAVNGGFNIRNNFIGGTAPGATGGDWTLNVTPASSIVQTFIPIAMSTGMIPNTISGNVIRNIDFTTVSPTAAATQFAGMSLAQGLYTVSGNTIGSPTTTGNIKININVSTGTNSNSFLAGVLFGSTAPCGMDFLNNSIGSLTIAGSATAAVIPQIVQYQGNPVTAGLMQGNTIGSTSAANSIQLNFSANPQTILFGIRALPSNTNFPVINNNIVQNITDNSSSTAASDFGILVIGSVGPVSNNITVTNNTVANISSNSSAASPVFNCYGIAIQGANGTANVSGNTISGIRNSNPGVTAGVTVGVQVQSNGLGGTMSRNKIYDLTSVSTGTGQIAGIYTSSGSTWTYSNNMITLTNGEVSLSRMSEVNNFNNKVESNIQPTDFSIIAANYTPNGFYVYDKSKEDAGEQQLFDGSNINNTAMPNQISNQQNRDNNRSDDTKKTENITDESSSLNGVNMYGIAEFLGGTNMNAYYNSIYIGGSATTGAFNTYAFLRGNSSNINLTNNLLYNNRTGGTGFHYAIGNTGSLTSGWNSSNYNAYVSADTSYMGEWGAGSNKNIDAWRTSSGTDNNSWYAKNTQVPAAQLFTSISTGNLVINTANAPAWLVKGKGIAIASINTDYSGNSRSTSIAGGTTCIGVSEFTATPPSNPLAFQSAAPSSGGTTDYVLFGRKIASITWGTGGTYPTSMNVNYFSGVSPLAPNVTNPARNSNSYWTVNPATGTFSGTTYDITFFYGDNETFSVTSPSTNVLLAKNDNVFWMSYPRGTGSLQSEQAGTTVKVRGLFRFSSFTLTDAGLPAERPLTPVNNAINQPTTVTMVWNKSLLATTYRVQVATDSTFATGILLNDSTVTDSTKVISGLGSGVSVFWRVNGKSGAGTGAWSQVYKFTTTAVLPPAVVNLSVIPGGFYNSGTGRLNMKDTIRVYLVDSASCLRVDSAKSTVDSVTFGANISFSNANTGNYYMLVYHRNHLAVATRYRATITRGSTVNYDFTTDSTKAFGFNMIKVSNSPVRWAMIPGDANRDGFVDAIDQTIWIAQNGLDGYLSADFNGDMFVDAIDQAIWIIYNGTSSFLPCGFSFEAATDKVILNTPDFDAKKNSALIREKKKMLEPVKTDVKKDNNRK